MRKGIIIEGIDAQKIEEINARLIRVESLMNNILALQEAGGDQDSEKLTIEQACKILDRSRVSLHGYTKDGKLRKYYDESNNPYYLRREVILFKKELSAAQGASSPSDLLAQIPQ